MALQALIASDQLACSLYAWKSVAYSLDEPWDACTALGQSQGPCLSLHFPVMEIDPEQTRHLGLHIGETVHSRIAQLTTELQAMIGEKQRQGSSPSFTGVLRVYFARIQVGKMEKGLKSPLLRLFEEVVRAAKAAKGLAQKRKQQIALIEAAVETEKMRKRLLTERLLAAWDRMQAYSEWILQREQRKQAAASGLYQLLLTSFSASQSAAVLQSFSQLKADYTLYKQRKAALPRLCRLHTTHLVRIQRLGIRKWRELVVRQGIKRWAAGKLTKAVTRSLVSQAWFVLLNALQRWQQLRFSLERLLRRRGREERRDRVGRRFAVWKEIALEGAMQRLARLQEVRVSARALAHVCRRILRSQQYYPAFHQIKLFSQRLSQVSTLLHPILLLASLHEKLHNKTCRWAYNSLLRFDREKAREIEKEKVRALAKMGLGTLKGAFREWIELARRMEKHPVISFTYWLMRAIDKIQHRSLAYGLSRIDVVSHAMGQSSDDSLVLLGESHEGPLVLHPFSPNLSSRSNTCFSPADESGPFLAKELDFEDSGTRPVELDSSSKDSTEIGSPKTLYKKMPSVRNSPNQSAAPHRPPWRAPSRSGLTKLPSGQAIDRRRAYDTKIKLRQSQSRLRLHSPSVLESPQKEADILEIQYQHFERNMARAHTLASPRSSASSLPLTNANPSSLRLRLVVFIRNLQKTYLKRVSLGWVAIQHPPPMHYVRFVRPQQVEVPEESDEENEELESSWKRRLILVAGQRLSKTLAGRLLSLHTAFHRLNSIH